MAKGLKLKFRKFFGLISTFVEVTGETLVGGRLFVPPFWIGLKYCFCSRTNSFIFTSIAPVLLDWSNETSWVFPALKSTSHVLPQSTVSHRSDASSEANSSCCYRSEAWSHKEQKVEQKVISSAWLAISHITSSGRSLMHSRKHIRPRMEPWGSTALAGYSCEDFLIQSFHPKPLEAVYY